MASIKPHSHEQGPQCLSAAQWQLPIGPAMGALRERTLHFSFCCEIPEGIVDSSAYAHRHKFVHLILTETCYYFYCPPSDQKALSSPKASPMTYGHNGTKESTTNKLEQRWLAQKEKEKQPELQEEATSADGKQKKESILFQAKYNNGFNIIHLRANEDALKNFLGTHKGFYQILASATFAAHNQSWPLPGSELLAFQSAFKGQTFICGPGRKPQDVTGKPKARLPSPLESRVAAPRPALPSGGGGGDAATKKAEEIVRKAAASARRSRPPSSPLPSQKPPENPSSFKEDAAKFAAGLVGEVVDQAFQEIDKNSKEDGTAEGFSGDGEESVDQEGEGDGGPAGGATGSGGEGSAAGGNNDGTPSTTPRTPRAPKKYGGGLGINASISARTRRPGADVTASANSSLETGLKFIRDAQKQISDAADAAKKDADNANDLSKIAKVRAKIMKCQGSKKQSGSFAWKVNFALSAVANGALKSLLALKGQVNASNRANKAELVKLIDANLAEIEEAEKALETTKEAALATLDDASRILDAKAALLNAESPKSPTGGGGGGAVTTPTRPKRAADAAASAEDELARLGKAIDEKNQALKRAFGKIELEAKKEAEGKANAAKRSVNQACDNGQADASPKGNEPLEKAKAALDKADGEIPAVFSKAKGTLTSTHAVASSQIAALKVPGKPKAKLSEEQAALKAAGQEAATASLANAKASLQAAQAALLAGLEAARKKLAGAIEAEDARQRAALAKFVPVAQGILEGVGRELGDIFHENAPLARARAIAAQAVAALAAANTSATPSRAEAAAARNAFDEAKVAIADLLDQAAAALATAKENAKGAIVDLTADINAANLTFANTENALENLAKYEKAAFAQLDGENGNEGAQGALNTANAAIREQLDEAGRNLDELDKKVAAAEKAERAAAEAAEAARRAKEAEEAAAAAEAAAKASDADGTNASRPPANLDNRVASAAAASLPPHPPIVPNTQSPAPQDPPKPPASPPPKAAPRRIQKAARNLAKRVTKALPQSVQNAIPLVTRLFLDFLSISVPILFVGAIIGGTFLVKRRIHIKPVTI